MPYESSSAVAPAAAPETAIRGGYGAQTQPSPLTASDVTTETPAETPAHGVLDEIEAHIKFFGDQIDHRFVALVAKLRAVL